MKILLNKLGSNPSSIGSLSASDYSKASKSLKKLKVKRLQLVNVTTSILKIALMK